MPIQPDKKPNPSNLAHGNYEKPPASTIKELQAKLALFDRSPFTEFLAICLSQLPSDEAMAKLRENDPHKWGKTIALFASLSGFVMEKKEIAHTVSFEHMSDLELLQFTQAQRKAIPLQAIEVALDAERGSGEDNEPPSGEKPIDTHHEDVT